MTEFTDALREFADFLDANPDLPEPLYEAFYCEASRELLRQAATIEGTVRKSYAGDNFYLARQFGSERNGISYKLWTDRATICRKVVRGTREIPEQVIPGRTEEVVEWVCEEPLLAPATHSTDATDNEG